MTLQIINEPNFKEIDNINNLSSHIINQRFNWITSIYVYIPSHFEDQNIMYLLLNYKAADVKSVSDPVDQIYESAAWFMQHYRRVQKHYKSNFIRPRRFSVVVSYASVTTLALYSTRPLIRPLCTCIKLQSRLSQNSTVPSARLHQVSMYHDLFVTRRNLFDVLTEDFAQSIY